MFEEQAGAVAVERFELSCMHKTQPCSNLSIWPNGDNQNIHVLHGTQCRFLRMHAC